MNLAWRSFTKRLIQWAVVIATIVVVIRVGSQRGSDLQGLDVDLNFFWLGSAAVATATANLLLPMGWNCLIASFGSGLATGRAIRLWCLAQTARYVPTGLLAVVSRVQLATKEGISRSLTLASVAIETGALLCWSVFLCTLFVPSTTFPELVRWLAGGCSALILFCSPWLIRRVPQSFPILRSIGTVVPDSSLLVRAFGLWGVSVAVRGIGTVCLAAGFLTLSSDDVPLVVGAMYAAVVAGMIGITPAGLGVREGVMTAILASRFGLADAAAFSLFVRAWEFGSEMLFLGAASWWGRHRKSPTQSGMDSEIADGKL